MRLRGNTLESGSAAPEQRRHAQVYWWHDKYRPRKPKYFNRVHTGYEWNKYNQTHYDHDNPPPKVVQVRQLPSLPPQCPFLAAKLPTKAGSEILRG